MGNIKAFIGSVVDDNDGGTGIWCLFLYWKFFVFFNIEEFKWFNDANESDVNEFEYIDVGIDDDDDNSDDECDDEDDDDEFVDDRIVKIEDDDVDVDVGDDDDADEDDDDDDDEDVGFVVVIVGPVFGDNDDNLNIISTNKTLTGNKMSKHA